MVDGRAGYRDLLLRLRKWRVGIRWYALAILPAPIVSAGILFTLSMTSPLFTADDRAAVFFGGLSAAATTFPEEIGWTGFVVPRLSRRHSVPMTGLIVGVLWGLWHFLQQVFVSGTYAGGILLLAFLVLSVFAAVASLTAYRALSLIDPREATISGESGRRGGRRRPESSRLLISVPERQRDPSLRKVHGFSL